MRTGPYWQRESTRPPVRLSWAARATTVVSTAACPAVNQEWAGRLQLHTSPRCSRDWPPVRRCQLKLAPRMPLGAEVGRTEPQSRLKGLLAAAAAVAESATGRPFEEAAEIAWWSGESRPGHWRGWGQRAVVLRRTDPQPLVHERKFSWRADPDSLLVHRFGRRGVERTDQATRSISFKRRAPAPPQSS